MTLVRVNPRGMLSCPHTAFSSGYAAGTAVVRPREQGSLRWSFSFKYANRRVGSGQGSIEHWLKSANFIRIWKNIWPRPVYVPMLLFP